ncbi:hypothetical protein GE09DRAFT_1247614 [Coniochaeta sp. 2T2.1]|nr:hypothetical protein GE09DRAFT_1247614 [Coniochaeta sp. 2T2.1]
MSTSGDHPLFEQWDGHVVPRSFNPGFVTLSYVVSLIGALSTLELINRRTSPRGKLNHLLLVSSAVTMGGIAIWCMHYIGNRAITLGNGDIELQIAYSSGFTAVSFFVPILVLLAAFIAIGTSAKVYWWRIALGGTLAGAAICGMHYLGNASISNYHCMYNYINVAFSAVIAVAASCAALALFFVFRATWTNSWWKRSGTAVLLAGAVSGMHWCAAMGTRYRLVSLNDGVNETSRNTTVIIVICLCVGAIAIIAVSVFYTARLMVRYASKAQQVVLATAIFDRQGRVLVSPEGLLPSEKITDSFLEKTANETFSVAHPLFQWMFQASRNWSNISSIVNVMIEHLGRLPHMGRDVSRNGIKLIDERGELIENYDIIFKELFCAAARALAEKTKSNLRQVGILWDEILPTGTGGDIRRQQQPPSRKSSHHPSNGSDEAIAAEKGEIQHRVQALYRGSLMFLVRKVDSSREVMDLEAAGYRFADLHQVSGIISSSMQIKSEKFETKLGNMAKYAQEDSSRLSPGVHLGFFAVRARVGSQGFDVLVRKTARHLLPSVEMPVDHLEPWQLNFLRQLDGYNPSRVMKSLENRKQLSAQDFFASQLLTSLRQLRDEVEDDIFEEATLTAKVVQIPCRPSTASSSPTNTATLITFKLVIPIHSHIRCTTFEFVPMSLFKVHQLAYKDSPHNLIFSRSVHREVSPILNTIPIVVPPKSSSKPGKSHHANHHSRGLSLAPTRMERFRSWFSSRALPSHHHPRHPATTVDADGNPIPTVYGRGGASSNHSSSTLKLWNPQTAANNRDGARPGERSNSWQGGGGEDLEQHTPKGSSTFDIVERYVSPGSTTSDLPRATTAPGGGGTQVVQLVPHGSAFGGIMVSQEITVNVAEADAAGGGGAELGKKVSKVAVGNNNRRPSVGSPRAEKGGEQTMTIEMQPLGNKAGVTVQAEAGSDAVTFVDELFAVCVESRG